MNTIKRFATLFKIVLGVAAFFAAAHLLLSAIHGEPFFSFRLKKVRISLPSLPVSWKRMPKLTPRSKPSAQPKPAEKPEPADQRRPAAKAPPAAAVQPPEPARTAARIAIVLDDWGYNMRNVELARSIARPVTFAILPNLRYSFTVAQTLYEQGQEIILHLPMEAHNTSAQEVDTVLLIHDASTISRIIDAALQSVRYARGVSNHTGSLATEDRATMTVVLTELKKRELYFLDSYVTLESKGIAVARSVGVPYLKRDIFLDNTDEPSYIRKQLEKLKAKALLEGEAVGIGHDRRNTLEVLQELMPEFEREGIKFVFVSDMLKR